MQPKCWEKDDGCEYSDGGYGSGSAGSNYLPSRASEEIQGNNQAEQKKVLASAPALYVWRPARGNSDRSVESVLSFDSAYYSSTGSVARHET
jgi:hypothetical protein